MQGISFSTYFSPKGREQLIQSIQLALDEDGADLTAEGVFSPEAPMHATIRAKEASLVVGLPLIPLIFEVMGEHCQWQAVVAEGSAVPAMTEVARIHATARGALKAERIILNFMTHLSGIANLTQRYVQALEGTGVRLLDTRKTTPCLRWAEKYAVAVGGGGNHRRDLAEILMLKDNHIDAAGSITAAVAALRHAYAPCPPIEVECRTYDDVREAVACTVDRIMLDNMNAQQLDIALPLIPASIEAEISGGVRLETIRTLAQCGKQRRADFISVGRLTHSAVAADFSMTLTGCTR
ncbi:MAG: carboxylating nicotinate-nucleotide diphosphorylase [Desulfovibrionaceae bacterium]|nr:carboxylating nicotinate-nucleotide diphosphorylase [Desulfovibrionaceae bacterium]